MRSMLLLFLLVMNWNIFRPKFLVLDSHRIHSESDD